MIATKRTHDEFYLKEDRSQQPKEYFKFMVQQTRQRKPQPASILDIGCASGDFLHYLATCFPEAELHGVDILESLVKASEAKVPGTTCYVGDINALDFKPRQQYDVVYMPGVHSIFDSCEHWVRNMSSLIAPGGIGLLFGLFNPEAYDVLVKVRKSGEEGAFESGWNCFSCETIGREFESHGHRVEFIRWEVPLDIPHNDADPLRSFTTPMPGGRRLTTNATRIIHDFYCAVITR